MLFSQLGIAQEKHILIKDSGAFGDIDEVNHPGASILTRSDQGQVHIYHDGIDMFCDKAIFYGKEDFVEAYGNVNMKQGDTINLTSKYVEYSGKTQLAFASGDVVLTDPQSTITTDTLYFNRANQESYYRTGGKVVRDSSGTITSRIGRYYMNQKKYRFVDSVRLVNPEYELNTKTLDYFSDNGHAYMYGPSTIVGDSSKIYSERGFYNTTNDTGYFVRKSRIDYDNRVIEGDSLYFDRNKNFASATNNIVVTDTINSSIIKGHYAEVYRAKDSVYITKRALAITTQETDSIYMHADTLMVTGKPEHRITRGYYNGKVYKSDISAKADSIHADHKTGLTQLINLKRLNKGDAFSVARRPILWNLDNQMTGDTIHLKSNPKTEKLDSLIVFNNAFLISKDTISEDAYNQISGKVLIGLFDDNNDIKQVDILKNAESINYSRNDDKELIGIEKSKSADILILFEAKEVIELRKITQFEGKLYTEEDLPKNARKLRGFDWRDDERPKSVEDLFKDDPPLNLPTIKGLEPYKADEEFFGDALLDRVNKADQEAENKKLNQKDQAPKASRTIPKKFLKPLIAPKKE
ncbi:LPS export ABC transporter periplasmic protein LptC [Olleya sp. YSTF-M6]|uniref:LPS export ABC transporter periplasmic protein LptC n=2 Tax=Olleya sediminilitoris TaxID=2795739 RepID=A0ABS1WKL7_9FLAO|nr:LPS export ABC transporter periplasmic protein LptC [Olleya sediminilitoris]